MNEYKIVKFFNSRFEFLDPVAKAVSHKFYLAIFLALTVLVFLFFDDQNGKNIFWAATLAAAFHFAISEGILKHTFWKRGRPYKTYPEKIIPIGRKQNDSSFPSSHVASTMTIMAVYLHFYPQYWAFWLFFALFMAILRLHSGMHYLSDILAGIILGIIYGALALMIVV